MAINAERNRAMLAAYEAGRTVEQLSDDFGLSRSSIGSILTGERHIRAHPAGEEAAERIVQIPDLGPW